MQAISSAAEAAAGMEPRVGKYAIPASLGQQRLWFLQELDENWGRAHQLAFAFETDDSIDLVALQQAVNYLVGRHESLRTNIARVDGELVQIIHPRKLVSVGYAVISGPKHLHPRDRLREFAVADSRKLIRFDDDALFRVTVLDAGDRCFGLFLKASHVIMDGTSLEVFTRELQAAYGAFAKGTTPMLPPPKRQFGDYAIWEWQWLTTPEHDRQQEYWSQKLRGCPLVFELPADKRRSATQSFEGALEEFELSPELTPEVRQVAADNESTASMVLLTAFAVLLSRYTSRDDFLIGMPVENRKRRELEDAIGFFANTVALRMDCTGDPTLRELLKRVRGTVVGAIENEQLSFSQLVNLLQPERSLSRNPIFQVMFVYKRTGILKRGGGPLPLRQIRFDAGVSKFDLTLIFVDDGDRIEGVIEYDRNLFERPTIRLLIEYFQRVLRTLVKDPECRVTDVSLLTLQHLRKVLEQASTVSDGWRRDKAAIYRIEKRAEEQYAAPAVVFDGRALTYGELNGRANQLARAFRARGIGVGDRVAVLLDRSPDTFIALLATLKAGATYVPLDVRHPQGRIKHILADVAARALVAQTEQLEQFDEVPVRLSPDDPSLSALDARNLQLHVPQEVPAYVIYTSGSTGMPKGVVIPREALDNVLDAMLSVVQMSPEHVLLSITPITFDISALEIYLPLMSGARIVLATYEQSIDGLAIRQLIDEHGVTTLQATPSLWRVLLEAGWSPQPGFRILCGGEALPQDLADRLSDNGAELYNLYGPTEATVWCCTKRLQPDGVMSVGRPLANCVAYVLDERWHPTPANVCGELFIGGEQLAHGYLNQPVTTARSFVPDPFSAQPGARLYRTGDLARYLHNGELQFIGRRDNQIKIRGFRVELGEIESVLRTHPDIKDAVVAVHGEQEHQNLVAFIVLEGGSDIGGDPNEIQVLSASLQVHLKKTLPEHMIPTWQVRLPRMPITDRGKIDRAAILAIKYPRAALAREYAPPKDAIEQSLAQIWAEVLSYDRVGRHDNFFELGGNSLLTGTVIERVEKTYGVRIPLREIFQNATIAYLAQAVRDAMKDPGYQAIAGVTGGQDRRARDALRNDLDEQELLSLVTDPNFTNALERTA
jgi:amino acid adenylation domain-containing protein